MDTSQSTRRTFMVIIDLEEDSVALRLDIHRHLMDACRFIEGVERTVLVQDITGLEGERK